MSEVHNAHELAYIEVLCQISRRFGKDVSLRDPRCCLLRDLFQCLFLQSLEICSSARCEHHCSCSRPARRLLHLEHILRTLRLLLWLFLFMHSGSHSATGKFCNNIIAQRAITRGICPLLPTAFASVVEAAGAACFYRCFYLCHEPGI